MSYVQFTSCVYGEVQRTFRQNFKTKLPSNIQSTGSSPGKLHGTAKIHKLDTNEKVTDLPFKPIISNVGTPKYHLESF